MSDLDSQLVFESGHWNHSGWTRDSRDGALVCSCGVVHTGAGRGDVMSPAPGTLQGLARDALADAVRRGQITALDLAGAVLRLADERSSALAVPKAEAAFLLACRDVVRVVESMEAQDRPKGWGDEQ